MSCLFDDVVNILQLIFDAADKFILPVVDYWWV